jgi:DNA polymerase V
VWKVGINLVEVMIHSTPTRGSGLSITLSLETAPSTVYLHSMHHTISAMRPARHAQAASAKAALGAARVQWVTAAPELAQTLRSPLEGGKVVLPLVDFKTPAGFPSPAADFEVNRVDVTQRLGLDEPHVFMGRVSGHSMTGRGIDTGDLIVVNRLIAPLHGHVVVAVIDNELTCKTLHSLRGTVKLISANPDYPDIVPGDAQEVTVWGVVTAVIKTLSV